MAILETANAILFCFETEADTQHKTSLLQVIKKLFLNNFTFSFLSIKIDYLCALYIYILIKSTSTRRYFPEVCTFTVVLVSTNVSIISQITNSVHYKYLPGLSMILLVIVYGDDDHYRRTNKKAEEAEMTCAEKMKAFKCQ